MIMKIMDRIRQASKLKDYSLSKELRSRFQIEITIPGINGYSKPESKSMRLDVLCGLRKLSGVSWSEFGKWLDDEFIEKK